MGVFVYDFSPFVWIFYLPLVRCAHSWPISHPHSWIKIIYKFTHDITSIYIIIFLVWTLWIVWLMEFYKTFLIRTFLFGCTIDLVVELKKLCFITLKTILNIELWLACNCPLTCVNRPWLDQSKKLPNNNFNYCYLMNIHELY